jgi:hypothetical protein
MNNLLAIEQNFLSLPQVSEAINLTEIKRAKRNVENAQKRKFDHTITMASLVKKAVEWFDSEEGKTILADEGIEWNKADFGLKVFGWQKSYFYKVVKVGNLDRRIVDAFVQKCDAEGDQSKRSLAGLLEFSRNVDLENLEVSEDATEEEIAEAEEQAIQEAVENTEARVETVFTLAFKTPQRNVAVRVDENLNLTTRNTTEEIREAVAFLLAQIDNA